MDYKKSFVKELLLRITLVFFILQSFGIVLFAFSITGELILKDILYIVAYEILLLLIILFTVVNSSKKRFEGSLSKIIKSMDDVKKGNLPAIVAETDCVEAESLKDSINSLLEHFNRSLLKRSQGLQQMSTSVKKIGLSMDGLSEGIMKQMDMIKSIEDSVRRSDGYKEEMLSSTQSLTNLSEDNVSALTEITSSGSEIEESIKQLLESSTNIHSVILEISRAVNEISKNMESLSVSVEQTSVAVDEMTASFKEIERGTKDSANLTNSVRNIAAEGMSGIADAMDGMDKIADSVNKNVEMIQRLREKSGEIEKILSVISDITKKTNLLSLNAAILSSQAGEEGKVFSVVADEIKVLADKTRTSAKEITEIIKSTQNDIEATLKVSGESLRTVEHGTGLVIKAGEALRDVIDLARRSAETATTIQKATHEQVMGISQINKSMEMIKNSVEDVTKATFMQEKGSKHILSTSEKIKEISSTLMRGIEEQNKAVQMMLRNLQIASEKVKHIKGILESEQSGRELISSIENINIINSEIGNIIHDTKNSFNKVYRETAEFMKGIGRF